MEDCKTVDFYNKNIHPITGYLNCAKKNQSSNQSRIKWIKAAEFNIEDYITSQEASKQLGIGTKLLTHRMGELGYKRVATKGKTYFCIKGIEELKKSDLMGAKTKLTPDYEKMISTTELAEKFGCSLSQRYNIINTSGLKPAARFSMQVYFYKDEIIPFFESFKAGTLKYKQRVKKTK